MKKKLIELNNISKQFEDNLVIDNLNLYINENEFITLLGPSGCGKTTILRMIGGFEEPTSGAIIFDGKKVNDIPANERKINTVFQNYALFPHLNVYENIAFGLRLKKVKKEIIDKEVEKALKMVKLSGFEKRRITSLSGGQKQRIAIARAIINKPKVLLLDEPLGALDLKLRQDMQYELMEIQQKLGITFIFVTHDQEEALTMSDTIVVLNDGIIQQIGTPEDIYNEPSNRFVASFIGESNIVDGIFIKDKLVSIHGVEIDCVDIGFDNNEEVDIIIRPEDIDIVSVENGLLRGIVDDITFKGVHYEITLIINEKEYIVHSTKSQDVGKEVGIQVEPENIHVMRKI